MENKLNKKYGLITAICMVVGIVIGLIGSFFKDLTNVIQYMISTENLKSEEPKMFGKNRYIKYLDVCLNGDGNLGKEFGLTNSFLIADIYYIYALNTYLRLYTSNHKILNKTVY